MKHFIILFNGCYIRTSKNATHANIYNKWVAFNSQSKIIEFFNLSPIIIFFKFRLWLHIFFTSDPHNSIYLFFGEISIFEYNIRKYEPKIIYSPRMRKLYHKGLNYIIKYIIYIFNFIYLYFQILSYCVDVTFFVYCVLWIGKNE